MQPTNPGRVRLPELLVNVALRLAIDARRNLTSDAQERLRAYVEDLLRGGTFEGVVPSPANGGAAGPESAFTGAELLSEDARRLLREAGNPFAGLAEYSNGLTVVDAQLLLFDAASLAGIVRAVPFGLSDTPNGPFLFWVTGLSGAGKSTLAGMMIERIRRSGRKVVHLDGDELRMPMVGSPRFDVGERRRLARQYARLCRLTVQAGENVICSTVSMFAEVRRENRESIARYVEIYLDTPLDVRRCRDRKGVYAPITSGRSEGQVVGLDVRAELPDSADLVVTNAGDLDELREWASRAVARVFD
jgi:cytidine diphosphoramidate kinase